MRCVLILSALLLLAGCSPTFVRLDEGQRAQIEARAGAYTPANRDAWLAAASEVLGVSVQDVTESAGQLTIKVAPEGQDLAETGVSTFAGKLLGDWTPKGLIGAAVATGIVLLKRYQDRRRLEAQAKTPK